MWILFFSFFPCLFILLFSRRLQAARQKAKAIVDSFLLSFALFIYSFLIFWRLQAPSEKAKVIVNYFALFFSFFIYSFLFLEASNTKSGSKNHCRFFSSPFHSIYLFFSWKIHAPLNPLWILIYYSFTYVKVIMILINTI